MLESDDCFRTVIACLLDRDTPADVPHFFADTDDPATGHERLREWLAPQGLVAIWVGVPGQEFTPAQAREAIGLGNPNLYYMMVGSNYRGVNHAVVCCGMDEIHDPAWNGRGLYGPAVDTGHYGILIIGTATQVR
jgi:hypothetical protein